ncbi:MAG: FAD-dependent oxidoreductase [Bacilli bacterium]|nr:FAD-dependent oxidoreductase [Bacilli bacterium]
MSDIEFIAKACLTCLNARCHEACPCGNEIPSIIAAVKRGDIASAKETLNLTNPFPELTSLLCDHERQCRGHCIRGIKGTPVDFPAIERYLANDRPAAFDEPHDYCNPKVAIVGAGPAGLSAAYYLRHAGATIDIFEKREGIGGAIYHGIPSFRFDKSCLDNIRDRLELGLGMSINRDEIDDGMLRRLSRDYDYVLLAVGAEKSRRLDCPKVPNISDALELLEDMNLKDDDHGLCDGKNVYVMGGGNVAMDVSRSLVRRGAKVTLIYRRNEESMPAQKREIQEAKDDGVIFQTQTNATAFHLNDDGFLDSMTLVDMGLGEKDESGRPSFFVVEGSERVVACDAFVMAIGETSAASELFPSLPELPNVRLVGDCRYGAKNVASAIKDGREAALDILRGLMGDDFGF